MPVFSCVVEKKKISVVFDDGGGAVLTHITHTAESSFIANTERESRAGTTLLYNERAHRAERVNHNRVSWYRVYVEYSSTHSSSISSARKNSFARRQQKINAAVF